MKEFFLILFLAITSIIAKQKLIDVEFIEAPGVHTWEFCEKYIKEFIKTLSL